MNDDELIEKMAKVMNVADGYDDQEGGGAYLHLARAALSVARPIIEREAFDDGVVSTFEQRAKDLASCKREATREVREAMAEAEKALEPFAKAAWLYEPDEGDGDQRIYGDDHITLGDLRRSRDALAKLRSGRVARSENASK